VQRVKEFATFHHSDQGSPAEWRGSWPSDQIP
jgi:hypothetical protein